MRIMPPLPPSSSWKRLFIERASGSWITIAVFCLVVFIGIFLTRVNASGVQKLTILALSVYAVWQLIRAKNIDMVTLLLSALGLFILFSLHRAEVLPVIVMMFIAGVLGALLTVWQGHHRFGRALLWRHAYLIGFIVAEATALLTYWIAYDDVLAKSIIITVLLYVWWGLIDLAAKDELTVRQIGGYVTLALLLVAAVLVTMKPIATL